MRLVPFVLLGSLAACATYRDELNRGQTAYEQNHHEQALAILRALEDDQTHFDPGERARYAYLRGMTDFRIGYRADARHWLGVAKEIDGQNKNALPEQWKSRLDTTLGELNESVWSGGTLALDKPVSKDKPSGGSTNKDKDKDKDEKSNEDKAKE